METVIKLSNLEFPLSLQSAKVIHANKYSETRGGAFNFPVSSTLYTDVVFRLNATNEDLKAYIKNLDLPIYTEQEVTVICSGKKVIGYIDTQTQYYYYLTYDFSRLLGLGFPFIWVWIIGILGGIVFYFIFSSENLLWLIPFGAAAIFYLAQKRILNYRIQKSIDNYLR